MLKKCSKCHQTKPIDRYTKTRGYYYSYCKDCRLKQMKNYNQNYYKQNKNKFNEKYYDEKYRKIALSGKLPEKKKHHFVPDHDEIKKYINEEVKKYNENNIFAPDLFNYYYYYYNYKDLTIDEKNDFLIELKDELTNELFKRKFLTEL